MAAESELDIILKNARERKIPVILDEGLEVLIDIVRERNPKRILEIGTAVGYSGIAMLNASGGAILDTIEIDGDRLNEARRNFDNAGLKDRVNLYPGDLSDIIPTLGGNSYDLVFIDAAKSKYLTALNLVEPLLKSDSVVVADNVYFRGMVRSEEEPPRKYRAIVKNLRAFIDYITSDKFETLIFEKGDGVAVTRLKQANIEKT